MNNCSELLTYCYHCEEIFVDEIDRMQNAPQQLRFLPENTLQLGGGWLFMAAELGSGDWNLARLIGDARIARQNVDQLPALETHLLLPETASFLFSGSFRQLSSLMIFVSTEHFADQSDETIVAIEKRIKDAGFCIRRSSQQDTAGTNAAEIAIYLLHNDLVKGYIKTIRSTRNCLELYIEILPSLRQRGFGKDLLRLALAHAGNAGKKIVYTVDEENVASIATAEAAGLLPALRLARFLRRP